MLRYVYSNHGLKIEEQWFPENKIEPPMKGTDIINVFAIDGDSVDKRFLKKQISLVTDLTEDEDQIYQKIGKNTKYEIRRSEKEGDRYEAYLGKAIPDELLNQFGYTFSEMYKEKGLIKKFNYELVRKCMDDECIVFSVGYHADEPIVFHSYIIDDNNARLYQSCSLFRGTDDPEKAKSIGFVNRALHWYDICYFKRNGLLRFDWGGISSYDNPAGIDSFKIGFGGTLVEYYNYSAPVSIIGKIYFLLKK